MTLWDKAFGTGPFWDTFHQSVPFRDILLGPFGTFCWALSGQGPVKCQIQVTLSKIKTMCRQLIRWISSHADKNRKKKQAQRRAAAFDLF